MKNCIGKLVMLVAIFLSANNVSAANVRHIYLKQVTPEFNEFLDANLPNIAPNEQPAGKTRHLSMAKIQQARQNNVNGINVLNGVQVGDRVIIMGGPVIIVP